MASIGQTAAVARASSLDRIFRQFVMRTRFFQDGFGTVEEINRILTLRAWAFSSRENLRSLVAPRHPVVIEKSETFRDCRIMSGRLQSPLTECLPGALPRESETAHFELILPKVPQERQPICIHFGGTGDHYFWRRRMFLAKPLLAQGIGSIILENPYYGVRKPAQQYRSSLRQLNHLFVMGASLVLESVALFQWCEKQGYGPFGVTGISMGGHMASLAAGAWHEPLAIVPCMSASTAAAVFIKGVMRHACAWKELSEQLKDGRPDLRQLLAAAAPNSPPSSVHEETVVLMRYLLDEATSLRNFLVPVTTKSTIFVVARHDAYVPPESTERMLQLWPGSELRYVDGGHVSSFFLRQGDFRRAITDAFARLPPKA
eukprot:Opistho-2@64176